MDTQNNDTLQSMVVFSQDNKKFIFAMDYLIEESEYFRALLESGMVESTKGEVSLPCISSRGLQVVEDFFKSKQHGEVLSMDRIAIAELDDIIHTAIYLQMATLLETCERHLIKNVTVDNLFEIRTSGKTFSLQTVSKYVDEYLKKNISAIWPKNSFFDEYNSFESLASLLSSDDLDFKDGEMEAFLIIEEFTKSRDLSNMDVKNLPKLLNSIRFPLIQKYKYNLPLLRIFIDDHKDILPIDVFFDLEAIYERAYLYQLRPNQRFTLDTDHPWGNLRCTIPILFGCGGFTQSESSTRKVQFLSMEHLKNSCQTQKILEFNLPKKSTDKALRLPTALVEHAVCVLNGYLYVAGGQHKYCSDGRHTSNKCYRLDPLYSTWTEIDPMNTSRSLFYLGALDGSLFAVCGWTGPNSVTKSVERYDVLHDVWNEVARVPVGLHEHAGCSHQGHLFVSGGYRGPYRGHLNQVWSYDPTSDVWKRRQSLTHSRSYHAMASIGEKVYVAGGVNYIGNDAFEDVMIIEVYDPSVDQWSDLHQRLPMPACCMSHLVLDTRLLIFGGHSFESDTDHNFLQIFDTQTGKFSDCVISSNQIQFFPVAVISMKSNDIEQSVSDKSLSQDKDL